MAEKKPFAPYPVSLRLEGAKCLVVGGGVVALRKVESLLESGATVTVVSPDILPRIQVLKDIKLVKREFEPADLDGHFLVISATNERSINEAVARGAQERRMLVNVVDVPELCNFYVNALVRRGDLAISISTGGASPAIAKRIRRELEERYGEEYEGYLRLMREYRPLVIRRISDPRDRQVVFEQLASSQIEKVYQEQGEVAARRAIEAIVEGGGESSIERAGRHE